MPDDSADERYDIAVDDTAKIEVSAVKGAHRKSVPVIDDPTSAPFIFADSLYSLNELGGVVRLAFVRHLVVPNPSGDSELKGQHVAILALSRKQFYKLADYFGKVATDMKKDAADGSEAVDGE